MASRPASRNTFGAEATLEVGDKSYRIYRLSAAGDVTRLPYSLKILLENLLRTEDGVNVTPEDIRALAGWDAHAEPDTEIRFSPARVLIHDSTGVPAMVELASMREAMVALGGDPGRINPQVPVELVVDHSVMADVFGRADALERNVEREYERNAERYGFLRWGQRVFDGLKVVPPGRGIVHQVNLEYLARVVMTRENDGAVDAYPDTLVGADSHTPTVNGLGIVAWGVGGIEAGSAMLGQPISMLIPRVVGFKLTGELPEGTTATDLVLTITEQLRRHGVVGTFVEFYGPGVAAVPLANRATIGNMSPEYGSTISIFPIDEETLRYLRMTGRSDEQVALVEAYAKEQGLWHDPDVEIDYSARLELDLSTVVPSLAGPKRPQDRISLTDAKQTFRRVLAESVGAGTDLTERPSSPAQVTVGGTSFTIDHGSIVLAAITACTNTSNPSVMIGAALLAKKAVERGLTTQPWVKTILAPGSTIVMDYYDRAGLTPYLEKLGFYLAGFGCMSCIGNSGPLSDEVIAAIHGNDLSVASVLSGNRNFEGRINADVKMNFLASPPLVVAYALAGTIDLDIVNEPLGHGSDGSPVYLSDIWPSMSEIQAVIDSTIAGELFSRGYADVYVGDEKWMALPIPDSDVFEWDPASMHLRRPPYFDGMTAEPAPVTDINGARVLVKLGDSVTTDHISPAGAIHPDSLAGRYLLEHGVERKDLNTLLSRRGNHEVVKRGAFANVRLRNQLAPGTEGGFTRDFTKAGGPVTSIFDAAESYAQVGTPLVVIAGMEYGTGSSRDTAAKGPWMLGVKAVIAGSFERIHRSNLIGMGILPLQFLQGDSIESLGLTGEETFDIAGIDGLNGGSMPETVTVRAGGIEFRAKVRLDTPVEADYYRHGGIMPYVLRHLAKDSPQAGPAPVTS